MKKLALLLVFLPFISLQAQEFYWTEINGQIPGNILTVSTDSSGYLFASNSQNKIFRSTDSGFNWQFLYNSSQAITKFSITSQQEIFAVGGFYQIIYSSNSGDNWEFRNSGIKGFDEVLTIAKTQSGKLLAGAKTDCLSCDGGGIYASTDNGINWVFVGLLYNNVNSIISGFGNKIFATAYDGVYLSTDDGNNWQLKNTGMQSFIKYLTIDDNHILYAATEIYGELMFKSLDEGETWVQCNTGLPNDEVTGLENQNNTLFVSYKNAGIYSSTDSGNTWFNISEEIPNFNFNSINSSITGSLLTSTSGGILKTINAGLDWIKLTNCISHLNVTAINCLNSSNILVGTENGGIFRSTDFGANWDQNELITTIYGYDVNDIDFQLDNKIFASSNGDITNKSLFSSTDNGISWEHIGVGYATEYGITSLYIDQNDKIYVGEFNRIYWTTNNGIQWLYSYFPNAQSWVYDIVSNSNGIVLAATNSTGVFRSTNNGYGFNPSGLAYKSIRTVAVDNFGNFYAGGEGLFKSTDNGVTWQEMISDGISAIAVTNRNIITAVGWNFYFSLDGGNTWQTINNGIENKYLTCIAIDSIDNIYLGSNDGVYMLNKPLPVELLSFTSSVVDNDVTLNWATATETNNSGFQIERRETKNERSEEWKIISFVNGYGTTTEIKNYYYKDENISAGKYQYRLKQIDFDGTFEYSNIVEVEILPPAKFSLEQNYPNPFNPSTSIQYSIASRQLVTLKIFNSLGQEVKKLVNEYQEAGVHSKLYIVNSTLPSGVFYYQLKAGEFVQTRKMIILK